MNFGLIIGSFIYLLSLALIVFILHENLKSGDISKQEIIFIIVLLIAMPVIGNIFSIVYLLWPKQIEKNIYDYSLGTLQNTEFLDYQNGVFSKDIIPIEDVLISNDSKKKQQVLINIVSNFDYKFIPFLFKALRDSDVDTVHYAASALLEFKKRVINDAHQLSRELVENRQNLVFLLKYLEVLENANSLSSVDGQSGSAYAFECEKVLSYIIDLEPHEIKYVMMKINLQMQRKDYASALATCNRFTELHGDSEEAYLMNLKLSYVIKDVNKFKLVFHELRSSSVLFSPETLDMTRFWIGEGV